VQFTRLQETSALYIGISSSKVQLIPGKGEPLLIAAFIQVKPWHKLKVTADRGSNTITYFVDGTQVGPVGTDTFPKGEGDSLVRFILGYQCAGASVLDQTFYADDVLITTTP
jgi:hypothetical protein